MDFKKKHRITSFEHSMENVMNFIEMPLVSILMTTYNSMPYLSEALDSIYAQTYNAWELVIVHETSATDGTEVYLKQLTDPRIKVLYCNKPGNISYALNQGIKVCRGEYIARMDSDDIMLPDRLKIQVSYMENHPDVGICGGSADTIGDSSTGWYCPGTSDDMFAQLLFFQPFAHPTFMFRKESMKDINYNESFVTEDYEILTRLALQTKIGNVQEPILLYRIHDASMTKNMVEIGQSLSIKATKNFYESLGLEDVSADICSIYGACWKDITEENFEDRVENILFELGKMYHQLLKKNIFNHDSLVKVLHKRWEIVFQMLGWIPGEKLAKFKCKYDALFKIMFECRKNLEFIGKKKNPLITVVLATYKASADLYQSFMTLRDQTFSNFEVFIVNDGNPSIVKYLLLFLNDERFLLMQNSKKLGFAESLNRGIRASSAKYIARADDDDWYRPDRFQKQVRFLEKHPDISHLSTLQYTVYKDRCNVEPLPAKHKTIQANLLFYCCISHTSCMWRRTDFTERNLYYDQNFYMEDYELWTRASMQVKFHCLQEPLVYYRTSETSADSRTGADCYTYINSSYQKILQKNLERLNVVVDDSEKYLLSYWFSPLRPEDPMYIVKASRLREILLTAVENNKLLKLYNQKQLEAAVQLKWEMVTYGLPNKSNFHLKTVFDKRRIWDSPCFYNFRLFLKRQIGRFLNPLSLYIRREMDDIMSRAVYKFLSGAEYTFNQKMLPELKYQGKDMVKNIFGKVKSKLDPTNDQFYDQASQYVKKLRGFMQSESGQRIKHNCNNLIDECLKIINERSDKSIPANQNNGCFEEYLASHSSRKLHINCGTNVLEGWLNTDLYAKHELGVYSLNLLEKFPFENDTFDYIFSEHGFEHFKIEDLNLILKECFRVLKKGGTMRISTPDLRKLIDFYLKDTSDNREYLHLQTDKWLPFSKEHGIESKALVLNNFFRNWGHEVIYDEETFCELLSLAGFTNIVRVPVGKSANPSLNEIELHENSSLYKINISEFESMVFECKK